jgi:hypothetical protein
MFGRRKWAVGVALAVSLVVASVAAAATPHDIYKDWADNGRLDGAYTQAELEAYTRDATVQGYGNPVVVVTPPTVYVCPEGTTPVPGSGAYPNGGAPSGTTQLPAPESSCQRPTPTVYVCPQGTTPVAGSGAYAPGQAPANSTQVPAPTSACETAAVPTTVYVCPPGTIPPAGAYVEGQAPAGARETPAPDGTCAQPAQPVTQDVAGVRETQTTPPVKAPKAQVAGVRTPSPTPLAETAPATTTLPFTGAELGLFMVVGLALLGAGVALRLGANRR